MLKWSSESFIFKPYFYPPILLIYALGIILLTLCEGLPILEENRIPTFFYAFLNPFSLRTAINLSGIQ